MTENEISYKIIGTAIELNKTLGPGLLESVNESALAYDLRQAGLDVKQSIQGRLFIKKLKWKLDIE